MATISRDTVSAQQAAAQEQQRESHPEAQSSQYKAEKRDGFNCEFVLTPPEHFLQFECPVCLQIIRDPYQFTCCGYSFCHTCAEHIKVKHKPCPTCNAEKISEFPDKRLKRFLYALHVRCSYKGDGCEWIGELGQLEVHLNKDPLLEHQLSGCQFTPICCTYCKEKVQRQHIQVHKTKHCTKRPFNCEYCLNYNSHLDNVVHDHWPVCGSYPYPCPNECGLFPQRQNVDSHVSNECPLETISCEFQHVGCEVKLLRKDMPQHTKENLLAHVSLVAASNANVSSENKALKAQIEENRGSLDKLQDEVTTMTIGNQALKSENAKLAETCQSLQTTVQKVHAECDQIKTENQNLKDEYAQTKQKLTTLKMLMALVPGTSIPQGPPVLTMPDFEQHRKDGDHWYSPPVYTHHKGYKICLKVRTNGSTNGEYVSVGVHFMRGEFDEFLKWPFRGLISFCLMDQLNGDTHKTITVPYDDKVDDKYCSRVMCGTIADGGRGTYKFVAHSDLKPTYLRNDSLVFQIYKVELLN